MRLITKSDYEFPLKSLLLSLFVLSCLLPFRTIADTAPPNPPLLQMPVDARIAQLTALMDKYKFAPDQYQYIPQFIANADNNSIPPTLLVCIDLQESSGGKRYLRNTHNPFGWGSGHISFSSESEAINYISDQLGNGRYYKGKSLRARLLAYNPNPQYATTIIHCTNE